MEESESLGEIKPGKYSLVRCWQFKELPSYHFHLWAKPWLSWFVRRTLPWFICGLTVEKVDGKEEEKVKRGEYGI